MIKVNKIPHVKWSNYQLNNRRKKQWILASATALTAFSTGLASVHAADQSLAASAVPATEEALSSAPTSKVHNEQMINENAASLSQTPVSANETSAAQSGSVAGRPAAAADVASSPAAAVPAGTPADNTEVPPQPDLPNGPVNTDTVYGSQIDPSKYSLTFQVAGLVYRIPKYNLVDGDLRFATNEEVARLNGWTQPALVGGRAVNVGRYLVFLSKPGYDHLLAWLNGHWEGNLRKEDGLIVGDRWVPDASLENIALPPYNLANIIRDHWYAFYIVSPYTVKAIISGQTTVSDNGNGQGQFNAGQYTISFSGTAGTAPFASVSNNFSYRFQNGDLAIGKQNADGSYRVELTAQGVANLKAALDQAFYSGSGTDHAANYLLDLTSGATVIINDLTKQVVRTIIIHNVDGTTTEQRQTVVFKRGFTTTAATGVVNYGNWYVGNDTSQSAGTWSEFIPPVVAGYQAIPEKVAAATVNGNTPNQTVDIRYQQLNSDQPGAGGTTPGSSHPTAGTGRTPTMIDAETQQRKTQADLVTAPQAGKQAAQQLPQTGANQPAVSRWGLVAIALTSLFGIGWRKKRPDSQN